MGECTTRWEGKCRRRRFAALGDLKALAAEAEGCPPGKAHERRRGGVTSVPWRTGGPLRSTSWWPSSRTALRDDAVAIAIRSPSPFADERALRIANTRLKVPNRPTRNSRAGRRPLGCRARRRSPTPSHTQRTPRSMAEASAYVGMVAQQLNEIEGVGSQPTTTSERRRGESCPCPCSSRT